MKRFILIQILLVLTLAGCRTTYLPVVGTDTVTVVTEVIRDSIITLPADSSFIRAYFECDSLNQVVMTELQHKAGEKVKQQTTFNRGKLVVAATIDSLSVYIKWKERHDSIAVTETIYQPVPVEKIVYKTRKWVKTIAGIGAGSIALMVLLVVRKLKK